MFVYMDDLAQVIASGGAGGGGFATQARGFVMPGHRPPIGPSALQQQSLARQGAIYTPPTQRSAADDAEVRRQQAAQRAVYGSQVKETAGSRAAAGTPVNAEVLRQQQAQRDEMTKRGVAVKDTRGSQEAAWGPMTSQVRTTRPATTPPPPPPLPPTGPRPSAPWTPDYITRFVNTPKPTNTIPTTWETSTDWLDQYDPQRAAERRASEAKQNEALRRVAEREAAQRSQPNRPSRSPKPGSRHGGAPKSTKGSGQPAKPNSGFKPSASWLSQFHAEWSRIFGGGGAAPARPKEEPR